MNPENTDQDEATLNALKKMGYTVIGGALAIGFVIGRLSKR